MANQEHLHLLKQSVRMWNQWREEHPSIKPDLSETILRGANLCYANLTGANLFHTDLSETALSLAVLREANLSRATLSGATLVHTILWGANLSYANLTRAILTSADLGYATIVGTNLDYAILSGTNLNYATFNLTTLKDALLNGAFLNYTTLSHTILKGADLSAAILSGTNFMNVDLCQVKGLDTVTHRGPSTIGIDTIYRSQGHIPEVFLRSAGVPETFITYMHSLLFKPIDYYTCFISYSSQDQAFADRLYTDLQSKGVRCWFAPHDMRIGDEIRPRIDESIRLYDKLLLVLSTSALASDWVQIEVEIAFEKERDLKNRRMQQRVLFPIRLDDHVMLTKEAWAADIRRRKHIGDFTRWKQHDDYQLALERLLRDLKAEASVQEQNSE